MFEGWRESSACFRVEEKFSETYEVEVGVGQGCVMSPWLFN